MIPAVAAEDGCWLISEPLAPILKPGGHGVIWKLAFDKGVFDWFYKKGCKSAIVRQIRLEDKCNFIICIYLYVFQANQAYFLVH